jgi:hypothetical protein
MAQRTVLLALLLSHALLGAQTVPAPISFADLGINEAIEVRVISHSCFDRQIHDLKISRDEEEYVAGVSSPIDRHVLPRLLPLNAQQVAGLDRLLAYYRRHERHGCTNSKSVTLTRRSASGQLISTEEYLDDSCGTEYPDGVTLLPELLFQPDGSRPANWLS